MNIQSKIKNYALNLFIKWFSRGNEHLLFILPQFCLLVSAFRSSVAWNIFNWLTRNTQERGVGWCSALETEYHAHTWVYPLDIYM